MELGQKASITKNFNLENVKTFLSLSVDSNPIHYNPDYSPFKGCIVPGVLVGSLIGGLLGSTLPGLGTIYLNQSMDFKSPIFIDEKIKAEIEVIKIREDKPIITFNTICYNSSGKVAIYGTAVVKISKHIK